MTGQGNGALLIQVTVL